MEIFTSASILHISILVDIIQLIIRYHCPFERKIVQFIQDFEEYCAVYVRAKMYNFSTKLITNDSYKDNSRYSKMNSFTSKKLIHLYKNSLV